MPLDVTEDLGMVIVRKCDANGRVIAIMRIVAQEVDFLAAELSVDLGTPLEFARRHVELLGAILDGRCQDGDYQLENGVPRAWVHGDDLLHCFNRVGIPRS